MYTHFTRRVLKLHSRLLFLDGRLQTRARGARLLPSHSHDTVEHHLSRSLSHTRRCHVFLSGPAHTGPKRAEVEEHSPEIAALLDKVVVGQSIHPVTGLMSPGTPDGGGVVGGDLAAGSLSMLPLSAGPGTGVHGVHDAVVHGDEAAVVVEEEDAADPDLIFPLMEVCSACEMGIGVGVTMGERGPREKVGHTNGPRTRLGHTLTRKV